MYASQRRYGEAAWGTGTRLATPPGTRRGRVCLDCQGIQVLVRHPYIAIRFLVATCPANGTGPREAPLITASGEGFIYHSTLLHPAHFLPLTLHTPAGQHCASHPSTYQCDRPATTKAARHCDPSRRLFSLPCSAVNKGRLVSSLSPTQLPATLRVPLALSHGRTWPADAVIRIKPRPRSS